MKFLKFFWDKKIYIILNVLILLLGYILIEKGISTDNVDKVKSSILLSVGTSFIATGVVTFLDLFKQISITSVLEKYNNVIFETGINWVFKKRDLDKYDSLMDGLSSEIDIVGYSLGSFFDSYSELVKDKLKSNTVNIRVILVNPNSLFSAKRAQIEGRNPDQFKDKINTLLSFFKDTKNIEIRYIDAPISSMIFRIDKVMFVGPHFYKIQSKATHTIELKSNHWLYDEYQKEFNRMWTDAAVAQ